jgi:hypothetical protein
MQLPPQPKIYHIVHVDRLRPIIVDGCLWCDAVMAERQGVGTTIGMNEIKARRLYLPVTCHAGSRVGDYVPFYFCSRSIMLYVIRCANHPSLTYRGGQEPILHLEADLYRTVRWADANRRRSAFSLSTQGRCTRSFGAASTIFTT